MTSSQTNKTVTESVKPTALSTVNAASYIGVAPQTLANWRVLGEGPQYIRLGEKPGARIVYLIADLDKYLNDRLVK